MWHLQDKGYKESDILYIKPAFYSKMDSYGMNVQFKDEPNESYTYRVLKDAKTNKLTVHQDSNESGGMGGNIKSLNKERKRLMAFACSRFLLIILMSIFRNSNILNIHQITK